MMSDRDHWRKVMNLTASRESGDNSSLKTGLIAAAAGVPTPKYAIGLHRTGTPTSDRLL